MTHRALEAEADHDELTEEESEEIARLAPWRWRSAPSLTKEQLAIRRTGITAGDARALAGVDPYGRNAHTVWLDKLGLSDPSKNTEAKRLGLETEPIILHHLEERVGLFHLQPGNPAGPRRLQDLKHHTLVHPKHHRRIATPDAFFANGTGVANDVVALGEAKLVGYWNRGEWGPSGTDEYPDWALVQCTWQAHVAGVSRVHLGAMIGTEVRIYTLDLEEELVGVLVERAEKFWRDHIVTRKPPAVDGSKASAAMLSKVYPRASGVKKKADKRADKYAARYFETAKELERVSLEHEKAKQALIVLTGQADALVGDGWQAWHRNRAGYVVKPSHGYTVKPGRRFRMVLR
jgi:predicted phage-related endonuclease